VKPDRSAFAAGVVGWQKSHGRNDLPWQGTRDPYRVWLSEIMLQQTQVVTVRAYFVRFVERFPDVQSLARASLDEVLGLWSGLGYYSRARNLHRCAQCVVADHRGAFPRQAQLLETLPGIGRSTAAAIASLCFGERVAILDANVKRVVARVLGFDADLSRSANARNLWTAAERLLPAAKEASDAMPGYTQGMMDLGALVCLPRNPRCGVCPVRPECVAATWDPHHFPVRSRKIKRSSQSIWLLWVQAASGAVWLSKRPSPGVWAGLYCLPHYDSEDSLQRQLPEHLQADLRAMPAVTHVLTHKDLFLHPRLLHVADTQRSWGDGQWLQRQEWPQLGLPAPIRKMLERAA
jgi:A/G-specific adenine glycosylase